MFPTFRLSRGIVDNFKTPENAIFHDEYRVMSFSGQIIRFRGIETRVESSVMLICDFYSILKPLRCIVACR